MLEQFADMAVLISKIESIAGMDLRDIKCIWNDENDYYDTVDKDDHYIWDTVGKPTSKDLEDVLKDLDSGYTAIPF